MLRVGLTGELGSGKSTVARLLAERGAVVLSSDEIGRNMMQPGEAVYQQVVEHFGPAVVQPDGTLDRRRLAALAFDPQRPRIEELNAIVHPAVLAEQERRLALLARTQPHAIVIIESALIFTTQHAGAGTPWRTRFDRILLVTAPDPVKVQRYLERVARGRALSAQERAELEADAHARLAAQRISAELAATCITIENAGDLAALSRRAAVVFRDLQALEAQLASAGRAGGVDDAEKSPRI
jgi:dephospho-CoA kinase